MWTQAAGLAQQRTARSSEAKPPTKAQIITCRSPSQRKLETDPKTGKTNEKQRPHLQHVGVGHRAHAAHEIADQQYARRHQNRSFHVNPIPGEGGDFPPNGLELRTESVAVTSVAVTRHSAYVHTSCSVQQVTWAMSRRLPRRRMQC